MVGKIIPPPPKNCLLYPSIQNLECVRLYVKGEIRFWSADFKRRLLDYPCRPNVITTSLESEEGDRRRGQSDVLWEGLDPPLLLWTWRKSPRAKEWGQPLETRKSNDMDSPLGPPEGTQPTDVLILVQWDLHRSSNLQNWKVINVCRFKPWNFWQFDPAGIGNWYRPHM